MRSSALALAAAILAAATSSALAASRLEELRAAQAALPVIPLHSLQQRGNYSRFALEGPREYGLLVLMTARNPRYGCPRCAQVERELALASEAYARTVAARGEEATLFFAVADFETTQDAFAWHGFQSVPHIVFRPPESKRIPAAPTARVPIPAAQLLSAANTEEPGVIEAQDVFRFAQSFGYLEGAVLHRPVSELNPIAALLAALLAVAGILLAHDPGWLVFVRQRQFWLAFSVLIYGVAISGVVYCVIRTPPFYAQGADGKPSLFSSDSQGQYLFEGLFLGALNLAFAACVIGLLWLAQRNRSEVLHSVGIAVLAALALALFLRIVQLYADKSRWYNPNQLVPPEFVRAATDARTLATKRWKQHVVPILQPVTNALVDTSRAAWNAVQPLVLAMRGGNQTMSG